MSEKSQYKSLSEWRKNNVREYRFAKRNGRLNELCEYFGWDKKGWLDDKATQIEIFDKETIINLCTEYKTKKYWKIMSIKSYNVAKENGWMKECEEILNKVSQEWWDNTYMNL